MPRLVFRSLAMAGSPFGSGASRSWGRRELDGAALLGGAVQRGDRAGLRDGVVAAEQRRALAAHRALEVGELERVRVRRPDLDALGGAVGAADLDHRLAAVPRVVEEQRAAVADRLEL